MKLEMQESPAADIGALTGLRFIAAAWVVLYHFWDVLAGAMPPLARLQALVDGGYIGVDLFFVLSGFIISHVYLRQTSVRTVAGASRFLWLRLARFYPVHLLTLVVAAGLYFGADVVIGGDGPHTPTSLLRNITLMHAWGSSYAWNGPAWSISAEWFAYLLFPVASLLLIRCRRTLAWLGVIFALPTSLAIALALVPGFWNFESGPPVLRISGGFAAGCCAYLLYEMNPTRTRRWGWIATGSTVAMIVAASVVVAAGYNAMLVSPIMPLVIYSVARGTGAMCAVLTSPQLLLGGAVSYSLYMTHLIVLELFLAANGDMVTGLLGIGLTLCALLATLAVAYATYQGVEEPCRRAMRRWLRHQQEAR